MTQPTPEDQAGAYYVFIACPQDMHAERTLARKMIEGQNVNKKDRGFELKVLTGEDVPAGGAGCDPGVYSIEQTLEKKKDHLILFIALLGRRFGTPTGVFDSGTEAELGWALAIAEAHGYRWPQIKIFFCNDSQVALNPTADDSYQESQRIAGLRKRHSRHLFTKTMDRADFEQEFTKDLQSWLQSLPPAVRPGPGKSTSAARELENKLENAYQLFRPATLDWDCPYIEPVILWKGKETNREELLKARREQANRLGEPYVVISPPGAGKSLLLSKLLEDTRKHDQAESSLAFLINLGSMDPRTLDDPKATAESKDAWKHRWPANLVLEKLGDGDVDAVKDFFETQNVHLFLDGLDEFALGNEKGTRKLLTLCWDLAAAGVRVTLACRAYYWSHSKERSDFAVAQLKEFDDTQARRFLGRRVDSLPKGAFKDPNKTQFKAWALNPKVLSFIRRSKWRRFGNKTQVFENWALDTAESEAGKRKDAAFPTAAAVLNFFGAFAVYMTLMRTNVICRTAWQHFLDDTPLGRGLTFRLSYDQASAFDIVAPSTVAAPLHGTAQGRQYQDEGLSFSHALVWEYFVAHQLKRDFDELLTPSPHRLLQDSALAMTATDFVPSSVYGFLSEMLGLTYLDNLLNWLDLQSKAKQLGPLPPRLLFNVIEYIGKTCARSHEDKAIEILLEILKDPTLDREGLPGDPKTLVRYNAARALERLHPGAPRPYFDWSSDWAVATWESWDGHPEACERWSACAIRGSRKEERKADNTPEMDINFYDAREGAAQQRDVSDALMHILATSDDSFLRVCCSHALVRWFDFSDLSQDSRLEELIRDSEKRLQAPYETCVHTNLFWWVRKAAWRLRQPEAHSAEHRKAHEPGR